MFIFLFSVKDNDNNIIFEWLGFFSDLQLSFFDSKSIGRETSAANQRRDYL